VNEDKSTRYRRLRLRADATSAVLSLLGLGFWWLLSPEALVSPPTDPAVPPSVESWGRLVTAGSLCLLTMVCIALPARAYRDVVLERRYFPQSSPARHWGRRALSAVAFSAVGGGVLLGTAVWAWQRWPGTWWLLTGIVAAGLRLALARVGPALVLPRVSRVQSLPPSALSARLEALVDRTGISVARIQRWTVPGGPDRAQAVLAGAGSSRCILLSDGLLDGYSDDEVEVVVAHELAHAAHDDLRVTLAVQAALELGGLWVLSMAWPAVAPAMGASPLPGAAHVAPLLLAVRSWQAMTAPISLALARHQERHADAFALAVTGRPEAFLSALRRLRQEHLADDSASALVHWWTQAHPRIAERVAMVRAFTRQS